MDKTIDPTTGLPMVNPNKQTEGTPSASSASSASNASVNTGGVNPKDLMDEIQKRLLSTSGAISSTNTKIEDTISGAISKLQESNTASKSATESAYNREIGVVTDKAANAETSFLESQRGFATNTAALRDLRTNNEKSIRDLEQRKQEVLLQGDSVTASKISDLILKKYEFEQNATQQVFSNLVSIGNFNLQKEQEKRLQQTQVFNEDSAKANIALKYGIEVKAGDTFQDVVNRAKPFASQEQQLQLDKAVADLELTKSQTNLARANAEKALKDKNAQDLSTDDFKTFISTQIAADPNATAETLKAKILALPNINAAQRKQAYDMIDAAFIAKAKTVSNSSQVGTFESPLLNTSANFGQGILDITHSITDYIFGKDKFLGMPNPK